jgi:hypothetical protein
VKELFGFVAEVTRAATAIFSAEANFRRRCSMAGGARKSWRELCNAALEARDPDELLNILQELNKVLKREEQVRRDFRHAMKAISLPERFEANNIAESPVIHDAIETPERVHCNLEWCSFVLRAEAL